MVVRLLNVNNGKKGRYLCKPNVKKWNTENKKNSRKGFRLRC